MQHPSYLSSSDLALFIDDEEIESAAVEMHTGHLQLI
jgi:hypothetical protein